MTTFTPPERAVILTGLRLVQRMIADHAELILTDDSGTPSNAAADAVGKLLGEAAHLSVNDIDSLYERVAVESSDRAAEFPVGVAHDLVAEFGDDYAADRVSGRDAAGWIAAVAPRVRHALQALGVPSTDVAAAPSLHCLLAELDSRFGDAVEAGEPLDEMAAAGWITETLPRVDRVLD